MGKLHNRHRPRFRELFMLIDYVDVLDYAIRMILKRVIGAGLCKDLGIFPVLNTGILDFRHLAENC